MIAPDGEHLALLDPYTPLVFLYRISDPAKVWEQRLPPAVPPRGDPSLHAVKPQFGGVGFVMGGAKLFCAGPDCAWLIDVRSQEMTCRPKLKVVSAELSYDGRMTIGSAGPFGVGLCELASETQVALLSNPAVALSATCIGPSPFRLVTGHYDGTVILWDTSGLPAAGGQPSSPNSAEATPARLWDDLARADVHGYQAVAVLAKLGPAAITCLTRELKPTERLDRVLVAQCLRGLSADDFPRRENATAELRKFGRRVATPLREALAIERDPEARRRLEGLLESIDSAKSASVELRCSRAVQVLETIASDEAIALLRRLSSGDPEADQTRECRGALQRLEAKRH